jgi:hypothetical protein
LRHDPEGVRTETRVEGTPMTIKMYDLANVASTDVSVKYPVSAARLFEVMSAEGALGDYHP